MIVSINQPAYLPWPGYFHRIAVSDLHVVLDHVQFEKNSLVNRNKVRTKEGWCWLTVPLKTRGKFGNLAIDQLEIANDPSWAGKHWETLRQLYGKAPHFAEHRGFFQEIYSQPWRRLVELIDAINSYLVQQLKVKTTQLRSSALSPQSSKADLVLELCRKTGASTYLSGPLGRKYLDDASFATAGIKVAYHDYCSPMYVQAHPGFVPALSVLDLLFNRGSDSATVMAEGYSAEELRRADNLRSS